MDVIIYKLITFKDRSTLLFKKSPRDWIYMDSYGSWCVVRRTSNLIPLLENMVTTDHYHNITHIETPTEAQVEAYLWTF